VDFAIESCDGAGVTDLDERWESVGDLIQAALALLPESFTTVAKRIGVSPNKFREMRDGYPGNYRSDTLVKVSQGLWGDPTVIPRVLAGEDPYGIPAVARTLQEGDWQWALTAIDNLIETIYETMSSEATGGLTMPKDVFEQILRGLETALQGALEVYERVYREAPPSVDVPFSWRTPGELRVAEAVVGLDAALSRYDAAIAADRDEEEVTARLQDVLLWQSRVVRFEREDLMRDARHAVVARRRAQGESGQPTRQEVHDAALAGHLGLAAESGDISKADPSDEGTDRPSPAVSAFDPDQDSDSA
jgi:hypothetical protein